MGAETESSVNSADDGISVKDLPVDHPAAEISSNGVSSSDYPTADSFDSLPTNVDSIRRIVRSCMNKVTEAQMTSVVSELTNLFSTHPRASVRLTLIEELCALLEASSPCSSSG